jgi:hypothetical protein
MKFFHHLIDVIRFMTMPREKRRLVFYSEGRTYWVHFEGIIEELLKAYDISICYISSGENDPGLQLEHKNYNKFEIDEGSIRNWLFENIETDVMVMTMPDLHEYQVKRSKHKVHYIYVQHSLVSQHMVYKEKAFDHFDTIFCAGPHHLKEIREMEAKYGLAKKNLVKHGYGRLDAILEESGKRSTENTHARSTKNVLLAPSWGKYGVIETVGMELVDCLLNCGFQVTLRPHPQTIKYSKSSIAAIESKYHSHPLFKLEKDISSQESLHQSDILISDWSGAAFDYAFGLGRQVLFIDVPRKINNQRYAEIGIEPIEVTIRNLIGKVVPLNEICRIDKYIHGENYSFDRNVIAKENVFNLSSSSGVGAAAIKNIVETTAGIKVEDVF